MDKAEKRDRRSGQQRLTEALSQYLTGSAGVTEAPKGQRAVCASRPPKLRRRRWGYACPSDELPARSELPPSFGRLLSLHRAGVLK